MTAGRIPAGAEVHRMTSSTKTDVNHEDKHEQTSQGRSSRSFTLYLLRHGEALHNVEEKRVQKEALETSIADGFAADDPETIRRLKDAREQILLDPTFFDAPLSDHGCKQAQEAREKLLNTSSCCSSSDGTKLPPPTEVYVSPLRRTLQTADIIFPNHENIRVREELRERLTGRPADNRKATLYLQEDFSRFSFHQIRRESMTHQNSEILLAHLKDEFESMEWDFYDDLDDDDHHHHRNSSRMKDDCATLTTKSVSSSSTTVNTIGSACNVERRSEENDDEEVIVRHRMGSACNVERWNEENEEMLRHRTYKLLDLLNKTQHKSIAVVTHKGFLRGFERGLLGLSEIEAPLFKNCELRVYSIFINASGTEVEKVQRLK